MEALKAELTARLERIPGVSHVPYPDREDGFSALDHLGQEIGHFHNFNELDLRLGERLIRQEGLEHYRDSQNHPKRGPHSHFIELRFHRGQDLDKLVHLVELLVTERSKVNE